MIRDRQMTKHLAKLVVLIMVIGVLPVSNMALFQQSVFAYTNFTDDMDDYSAGWGISKGSSEGFVEQNEGYIRIANPLSQYYFVVKGGSQNFTAPTAPYYVDIRARVRSQIARVSNPEIKDSTINEIGIRGNGYNVRLLLYGSGKAVNTDAAGSVKKEYLLDTTEYHDYRIVVHADYSYDLYVDGQAAWTDASKIPDSGSQLLKLGASQNYACDFDIDHVMLDVNIVLPTPSTIPVQTPVPGEDVITLQDNFDQVWTTGNKPKNPNVYLPGAGYDYSNPTKFPYCWDEFNNSYGKFGMTVKYDPDDPKNQVASIWANTANYGATEAATGNVGSPYMSTYINTSIPNQVIEASMRVDKAGPLPCISFKDHLATGAKVLEFLSFKDDKTISAGVGSSAKKVGTYEYGKWVKIAIVLKPNTADYKLTVADVYISGKKTGQDLLVFDPTLTNVMPNALLRFTVKIPYGIGSTQEGLIDDVKIYSTTELRMDLPKTEDIGICAKLQVQMNHSMNVETLIPENVVVTDSTNSNISIKKIEINKAYDGFVLTFDGPLKFGEKYNLSMPDMEDVLGRKSDKSIQFQAQLKEVKNVYPGEITMYKDTANDENKIQKFQQGRMIQECPVVVDGESSNVCMVTALYYKSYLKEVGLDTRISIPEGYTTLRTELDVQYDEGTDPADYKLKTMIWDDLNSQKPYLKPSEFEPTLYPQPDNVKLNLWKDGKAKAFTMSWDDGRIMDKQVVALMNRYGIKGTFNLITSKNSPSTHVVPSEYSTVYQGMEVASHSNNHLEYIKDESERTDDSQVLFTYDGYSKDINDAVLKLNSIMRYPIKGFAYPFGGVAQVGEGLVDTDAEEILTKAGHVYARYVNNGYNVSSDNYRVPENFLRWAPSCKVMPAKKISPTELYSSSYRPFLTTKSNDSLQLLYIWGHSSEIVDNNEESDSKTSWRQLEEFFAHISSQKDIWFATNIEIYDYTMATRTLKYTSSAVENPTDIDVWATINGIGTKIPAHGTVNY